MGTLVGLWLMVSQAGAQQPLVVPSQPGAAAPLQQFRLSVPGEPQWDSTAVLHGSQLVITDAAGRAFVYERTPALDAPDGTRWGFYSPAAGQSLRWPVRGVGTMSIGDAQGQNWRDSLQQIAPVPGGRGPAAGPIIEPAIVPGRPPAERRPTAGAPVRPSHEAPARTGRPVHFSLGQDRRGAPRLGLIDPAGVIRLYAGGPDGWRYQSEIAGVNLVPGAPVGLVPDVTPGLSRVFTIDATGTLMQYGQSQGGIPVVVNEAQFVPGGELALQELNGRAVGAAVDTTGRLWELDLQPEATPLRPRHRLVEPQPGLLLPGSPVTAVVGPVVGGFPSRELFVTSARGVITRYRQLLGGWSPGEPLAEGFVPGAPVGALYYSFPSGGVSLLLAAVDWRGQLQVLLGAPGNWQSTIVATGRVAPGAPVLCAASLEGPLISAVGVDGGWRVWRPGAGGAWTESLVQRGFPSGAWVVADPATGGLLCVDVRGRIVSALWRVKEWQCTLSHPEWSASPRLVSRQFVPGQALPPARVTLLNGSTEDGIAIQLADAVDPTQSRELRLAPGESQSVLLDRGSGGFLEEVYTVPGPAGDWLQHVERYPLPAVPRYSLAVWAHRTTYSYIDNRPNRPKGALPSFDLKSHVSLGVIDLPPGELLRDGETIDVYRAATQMRNPGAAGYFGLPTPVETPVLPGPSR